MKALHRAALACTAGLLVCGVAFAQGPATPGNCPQPRFTGKAPPEYYQRTNPLPPSTSTDAARALYRGDGRRAACATCHGEKGDGRGELAEHFNPPPRNFACAQTVTGIPDGQLFWIIRYGSPGTSMPAHPQYSEEQLWQLVLYLRQLAGPSR